MENKGYEKGDGQPFWIALLRNVYGVEELEQFLRSKSFAGGYISNVEVKVLNIENHELDIVVIWRSDKTPYYLNEDYKDKKNNDKIVKAGVVMVFGNPRRSLGRLVGGF